MKSDLKLNSLHIDISCPPESSLTPESCKLLSLRSSSLRLEDWDLRAGESKSQLLSETLQQVNLKMVFIGQN